MQPDRQQPFSQTDNNRIRLVLFYTSWSEPCRQLRRILDTLSNQTGNDSPITKIDLDHSPELADRWSIHTIPTTLLLSGETEIDRFIGLLSEKKLQNILHKQRK